MGSEEAETYLEISRDQLNDAELAFREGRYALCAFLTASSAENSTSALLIKLGAKPSKKHRNSLILNRLTPTVSQELQPAVKETIERMKSLEPHITKARYPIRKGLKLLPPSRFYTKEKAEQTLTQAQEVMTRVNQILSQLRPA